MEMQRSIQLGGTGPGVCGNNVVEIKYLFQKCLVVCVLSKQNKTNKNKRKQKMVSVILTSVGFLPQEITWEIKKY